MNSNNFRDNGLRRLLTLVKQFEGKEDIKELLKIILTVFFIKFISDQWDKSKIISEGEVELIVVPNESNFKYLYEKRNNSDIWKIFDIALDKLEQANQATLNNVFHNLKLRFEHTNQLPLKIILAEFNSPVFDFQVLNKILHNESAYIFERLVLRFLNKSNKFGEILTPDEIITLLTKLLAPKNGDSICDPFAGTGTMLLGTAKESPDFQFRYFGQEINKTKCAICRMNMIIHGIYNSRIDASDSITTPILTKNGDLRKFDIVVSAPPTFLTLNDKDFYIKNDMYGRFRRGLSPKNYTDYIAITHMVEIAKDGSGKVGVIVPHGVLFRGGTEGSIRRKFIEENIIEAVIGLPAQLFLGTQIKFALLIFNKNRKPWGQDYFDRNRHILLIDASNDYQRGRRQNALRIQDIERISTTFREFKAIDGYSHLASFDEVAKNDFNLNIPGYILTTKDTPKIDINAVKSNISRLERELKETQTKLVKYLTELEAMN